MNRDSTGKFSRLAVLTAFFVNGALLATWVSRIPAIQIKLELSEGVLGLILFSMATGVLAALSLAGGVTARYSSHRVTLLGATVMVLTLPALALSSHPLALAFVLFLFGAGISTMDVAMNEQAVLVERGMGRPLMSSFHAAFSVGGLAGALIGAGMASPTGPTPLFHFALLSIFSAGLMFVIYRHLVPVEGVAGKAGSVFRLPERDLWALGAVAFCSAIGEGAMGDWSAVYLEQVLETSESYAALGFAAFSATMTLGRVFGDALTRAWKPAGIVRAGGAAAAVGFLAAVLTREPVIALIGFAAVGLGLANIVPLSFSAAGNAPGIPAGAGIAGVATIGYAGFLAGPPIIGLIAEGSSLRLSLGFVMLLVGSLIFTAGAVSASNRSEQIG
jgi:predicted MFS family arabinose efflux permease